MSEQSKASRAHRALLCAVLWCVLLQFAAGALAQGSIFDSDGVKIHYWLDGEEGGLKEPVLLIHGFSANAAVNWRTPGIVRALSDDYLVITIDNRGHGQSDKPESQEDYGIKMVADAVGLLDHLDIEAAHVVGYSMGSMIGLKMAVEHPDRVRSLLLGGMGWTRQGDEIRSRYENAAARPSKALTACYRRFWELGVARRELEELAVPTALVVGSEDGLFETSVRPLREVRPDIPLTVVPGANHVNAVFRPELREAIREFVSQ